MRLNVSCKGVLVSKKEVVNEKSGKKYFTIGIVNDNNASEISCTEELFNKSLVLYKEYDFKISFGENQYGKYMQVYDIDSNDIEDKKVNNASRGA